MAKCGISKAKLTFRNSTVVCNQIFPLPLTEIFVSLLHNLTMNMLLFVAKSKQTTFYCFTLGLNFKYFIYQDINLALFKK